MIAFLSKILPLNNLNVVGVIRNENSEIFHLLCSKKKGNSIDIEKTGKYTTFDELIKYGIDPKLPLLLVIDGKGVLNKRIDFSNEIDVNWQKNIDFNTIYYTSLKSGSANFISFCRKNSVEETIAKFQQNGLQIVDIYIGSFLASLLQKTVKSNEIISGELLLEFENNELVDFKKQEDSKKNKSYRIGKEIVSKEITPLYGALIHFFIQQKEVSKTKNEISNIEEIIYKKAFSFFGITILIGFLVSLLFSYIMIQHYAYKNEELNSQNVYSNQSYQKIIDLEKQKEKKLNIIKESGFLSSKFLSFYAYQIINEIPSTLSLTQFAINPIKGEVKAEKKIYFDSSTVTVKGETFNEAAFSNWIEKMKRINWVQNLEIISLKKDKKNKSQFELKITIKNV